MAGVAQGLSEFRAESVPQLDPLFRTMTRVASCVQVTLARVWAALGLWSRMRLLWSVIGTGIFMPDADEMRDMIEGLKEADVMTEV
jgi:pheromone shutdown protein TraB